MISHYELITRIAAGALMGAIIGYERDLHGRPVGLRTHLLVGMAAATFMVVSEYFVYFQDYDHLDPLIKVDTSRIASTILSGIGFLAGGAILRNGSTVQGLTTAAGLWLVTAIGMCAGAGMYIEGAAVTVFGVFSLGVLRRFEDKHDNMLRRRVSLVFTETAPPLAQITERLTQHGTIVSEIDYNKRLDQKKISVVFHVEIPAAVGVDKFIETLEKLPNVMRVHLQVPS